MMAFTLRRPPAVATILTLLALAVLIGLGTWQMQRLRWKETLLSELARIDALKEDDLPVMADALTVAQTRPPARVRVTGIYTAPVIALAPRTWQGRPGYHILTPLRLPDNGALLVNRGWVSLADKDRIGVPPGPVTVSGLLREPGRPGRFVPPNEPEAGRWYSIDPAAMAGQDLEAAPMPVVIVPYVLYADSELYDDSVSGAGIAAASAAPGQQDVVPVTEALRWNPPNNHLGYALFWYCMAGVLVVIYTLRFVIRKD